MTTSIRLLGRLAVRAELRTKTGLAIGGAESGLLLGTVEGPVARSPVTGEPYVPGSSLKGKLRALLERALGSPLSSGGEAGSASSRREARSAHRCPSEKDYRSGGPLAGYDGCPICHLFGAAPEGFPVLPTRLITRDANLTEASRALLLKKRTDLPFTEMKSESQLDRLTAAATTRLRERVPGGAAFAARFDFSLYEVDGKDLHDEKLLGLLLAGLALLEEDYLGGSGSRGYGRVEFADLEVTPTFDGGLGGEVKGIVAKLAGKKGLREALALAGDPFAAKG